MRCRTAATRQTIRLVMKCRVGWRYANIVIGWYTFLTSDLVMRHPLVRLSAAMPMRYKRACHWGVAGRA